MVDVRTEYYYLLYLHVEYADFHGVVAPIEIHDDSMSAEGSLFPCTLLSIEQAKEERVGVYVDTEAAVSEAAILHVEGVPSFDTEPMYGPVGFIGKGIYFGNVYASCLFGIKQDVVYRYTHARVEGSCTGLVDRARSIGSIDVVYAGVLGDMNALLATDPVAYRDLFLDAPTWFVGDAPSFDAFDFLHWRVWSVGGVFSGLFEFPNMRYEIDDLDYGEHGKFVSEPCFLDSDSYCGPFEYNVGGLASGDLYSNELTMHIEVPRDVEGILLDASLSSSFSAAGESVYGPFYIVNAFGDSPEDRIVDVAEDLFPILSYEPHNMALVNVREELYKVAVARVPSHSDPLYTDVVLFVPVAAYVDAEESVFELCELFVVYVDTRRNVDALVHYAGYLHVYKLQERAFGAHRLIVFDKTPDLDMEHVPFVEFEQARLDTARYSDMIVAAEDLGELYSMDDTRYQLFVKEGYKRLEPVSFAAPVGFMEDALVATDGSVTIVVTGALTLIRSGAESFSFGAMIMRAPQVFTQEYRRYASILAAPSGWSRETLDRAKEYMESIDHASLFAMGAYPYGVARVIGHENIDRQYLSITDACFGEFEGVRFLIDVESVQSVTTHFRYRRTEIVSIAGGGIAFIPEPDGLYFLSGRYDGVIDTPVSRFRVLPNRAQLVDTFMFSSSVVTGISREEYKFPDVGSYPTTFSFHDVYLEMFTLRVGAFAASEEYAPGELLVEQRVDAGDIVLEAELSVIVDFATQAVYGEGDIFVNMPVDIEGVALPGPTLFIAAGDKVVSPEYARGEIALNDDVVHAKTLMTEYPAIWMQMYGKVLDDVADISARMFDFNYRQNGFSIDVAFKYVYVDEAAEYEDDRPKPKKDEMPSILLSTLHAQPKGFMRRRPETKRCVAVTGSDIQDYISYDIEDGGNIFVGNFDFDGKRDLYGSDLVKKSSVFLPGRYASDLGALKNRLVDIVEASLEEEAAEGFDIKNFRLTEEDFGGLVTEEGLRSINAQIAQNRDLGDIVQKVESITLSEYLAAHPEAAEEIRMALNDLVSLADAYVWDGVPTRRPIDGKLFKRLKMDHSVYIFKKDGDV